MPKKLSVDQFKIDFEVFFQLLDCHKAFKVGLSVIRHNPNMRLFPTRFRLDLFSLSNIKTLKFISYYIKAEGNDWIFPSLRWREWHLTTTIFHESILEPVDLGSSSSYNNADTDIDTSTETILRTNISVIYQTWSWSLRVSIFQGLYYHY